MAKLSRFAVAVPITRPPLPLERGGGGTPRRCSVSGIGDPKNTPPRKVFPQCSHTFMPETHDLPPSSFAEASKTARSLARGVMRDVSIRRNSSLRLALYRAGVVGSRA